MDAYLEGDTQVSALDISRTPNIEFQLNRWSPGEAFQNKQIPEAALFASKSLLDKLRNLYSACLDIPILVYGLPGCGKLTTIVGMMPNCPAYFPSITERYSSSTNLWDSRLINNIAFFKPLDEINFPKILIYENLYFLNIAILINNTEITTYIKQIYKIAKSHSIDLSRKIFIITHIDLCNKEQQRYITFMLDKLNSLTSYIFTTTKVNMLDKKIRTFCAPIAFTYPSDTEFAEVFKYNYGIHSKTLEKKHLTHFYIKKFWEIYCNNRYNIGNTIAQIKYVLSIPDISLEKLKLNENNKSLLDNIASNFIKKKMKLTSLSGAMEIRRFIYTLLSINIDIVDFAKCLIKQLLLNKFNRRTKQLIIEKAAEFSRAIPKINKELIAIETFIYQLIYIIYSGGYDINEKYNPQK
jgi:hypothetical protein